MKKERRFSFALLLSICLGLLTGFGPILAIFIFGIDVPTASVATFTSPAPPLIMGNIWTQTFIAPDRPIRAIALRTGTYGAKFSEGQVIGKIGPVNSSSQETTDTRSFSVRINKLADNKWYTFYFEPLKVKSGAECSFEIRGLNLPGEHSVTFWKNKYNPFPDGDFRINGVAESGDLCFKILCHVKYLDAFRMLKTRWFTTLSGFKIAFFVPILLALLWPVFCFWGFWFLLKSPSDSLFRKHM